MLGYITHTLLRKDSFITTHARTHTHTRRGSFIDRGNLRLPVLVIFPNIIMRAHSVWTLCLTLPCVICSHIDCNPNRDPSIHPSLLSRDSHDCVFYDSNCLIRIKFINKFILFKQTPTLPTRPQPYCPVLSSVNDSRLCVCALTVRPYGLIILQCQHTFICQTSLSLFPSPTNCPKSC